MKLSILIPSIPERLDKLKYLYDKLLKQIGDKDVEVITVIDNKKRSIGQKRQDVKSLANGEYFMMLDDDDDISDDFIESIWDNLKDVHVITFKQQCSNPDGTPFIIEFGLKNEIEHNNKNGNYLDCKRPPWHCCIWNTEVFKGVRFPDVSYGEDAVWSERANWSAQSSIHIDKILHYYNFDINTSQASTEDNEHWQNPN